MGINWNDHISKRYTFTARYVRTNGSQMLLVDVCRVDGTAFRDHLFVPYTARMRRLALEYGDIVRITGKVNRYYKKGHGQKGIPIYLATLTAQLEITNISSICKE